MAGVSKHRVPRSQLRDGTRYKKTFAWVLRSSSLLSRDTDNRWANFAARLSSRRAKAGWIATPSDFEAPSWPRAPNSTSHLVSFGSQIG